MKTVVITGSTRGIGFGLAAAFLDLGCQVVINGRTAQALEAAVQKLGAGRDPQRIFSICGDMTCDEDVQRLWDESVARFGRVDIWINNAGMSNSVQNFWDLAPELIHQLVNTNILGAMYGSRVAIRGMLAQGGGALYNLEGLGSSGGMKVKGMALYATSKAGLRYLDDSLMLEVKGTPVIVGALQPGMVATDLVIRQYDDDPEGYKRNKRIFNIIGERVEVVAPFLAKHMLANQKNGARIQFSNSWKLFWRFLTAPFVKRDIF